MGVKLIFYCEIASRILGCYKHYMLRTFQIGDAVPHFQCRSSNNALFHFNTAAGRYMVLSFFGTSSEADSAAVIQHIYTHKSERYNDADLCFFGVTIDPQDEQKIQQRVPGLRLFYDFEGAVSRQCRAILNPEAANSEIKYRPFTLVLDPLLRVIANIPIKPAAEHNAQLEVVLSNLHPLESYSGVKMHAPVLILPRVFEPEFCKMLIGKYEASGGYESGFMREKDGKTVGIYDNNFKRRRDYMVEEQELILAIQTRIAGKLLPEIKRAFQYDVTRMERYLVACYDSETGGFFRPHRDNTTKGTAHRRFAVTINLNREEYEGGNLRFPEFGPAHYTAPTGGAVVFSCSLLHEATPVTKGTRYAFLPFLYDDAAAKIRDANQAFLTGENYNLNEAAM